MKYQFLFLISILLLTSLLLHPTLACPCPALTRLNTSTPTIHYLLSMECEWPCLPVGTWYADYTSGIAYDNFTPYLQTSMQTANNLIWPWVEFALARLNDNGVGYGVLGNWSCARTLPGQPLLCFNKLLIRSTSDVIGVQLSMDSLPNATDGSGQAEDLLYWDMNVTLHLALNLPPKSDVTLLAYTRSFIAEIPYSCVEVVPQDGSLFSFNCSSGMLVFSLDDHWTAGQASGPVNGTTEDLVDGANELDLTLVGTTKLNEAISWGYQMRTYFRN